MKQYDTFITTGCSFTAGVIANPKSKMAAYVWPHFCFQDIKPEISNFTNLAIPGAGNTAALLNLVYFLENNKQLNSDNTLIGLNLTGLYRIDVICPTGIPGQDFGWKINGINTPFQKIMGFEQTQIFNSMIIIQCLSYLELRNFKYFFMILEDSIYTQSTNWLQEFLDQRLDCWIKFDKDMSMLEFIKTNKVTTNDNHPTKDGHRLIANHVLNFLNSNDY